MFCAFQHFVRSVLIRNSAISSLDSKTAIFFSSLLKHPPFQANKLSQSTSFPIIESMVYCQHLPNRVGASWLQRISLGIGANQRRPNILNEKNIYLLRILAFLPFSIIQKISQVVFVVIFSLLPKQLRFQANILSINLVSKQVCHRTDGILLAFSKYMVSTSSL